jgi:CheY-like chemotaxis protein
MHAGVVQAQGDPRGDYVLGERAYKDHQVSIIIVHACPNTQPILSGSVVAAAHFLHVYDLSLRCLEEGAEDFLLKPVQPSDVSRLCNRVLR